MKSYVILQKGFEYDDSIYSESEGGGGHPKLVTFSKDEVDSKIKELNLIEYKITSIRDYTYEIEDIINVDIEEYLNFNRSLVEKYGPISKKYSWEDTEYMLHPLATDEECEKYVSMVSIDFYYAVETDIDIQSFRNERINNILE
jgi:hypothetical protein